MSCKFFFEEFDDGLRRIIFKEEVEISFIVVDQTAEARNVDLPQIGIHYILHREIEDFLEKADFISFSLNKSIIKSQIGQQNDNFIQEHFCLTVIVILFHLMFAIADYTRTSSKKRAYCILVFGLNHRFSKPSHCSLEATI